MTASPQPPLPPAPPESQLIAARRKAMDPPPSYRKAAKAAGISPERWRQIETGIARVARGTDVPVSGVPADTIARMAHAVGATPAELESCGRADAAAELRQIIAAEPASDADVLADILKRVAALEEHFGRPPKRLSFEQEEESRDRKTRAV
jgi:hypothetical protein